MIGYTTIGANDFDRAAKFYDALAGELGHRRVMEFDGFILWGDPAAGGCLALAKPFDKKPATVGNGVMVALAAKSREQVDKIHQMALDMGGTDEGAPGARMDNFYAGYFRDPEGNKLNAFVMS